MTALAAWFAAGGPLAGQIPGFVPRPQQVAMAERIAAAIETREALVVEAGTGTGKTVAYLVPALLAGGKVLLSTASKPLQDQLYHRDLPAVRKALGRPVSVALLKGRANYVCPYHLERALASGRFRSREEIADLQRIARFAAVSDSGDRMALAEVAEEATAWSHAVSSRDNCLGGECPNVRDCFVLKARKKALEADVVVINHHLFFADIWLRDEGAGELLPSANVVILDEAHPLPEIASLFFGERVSTGQIVDLCRDVREETAIAANDYAALPEAAAALEKAARDARLAVRIKSGSGFGNGSGAGFSSGFSSGSERWPADRLNDAGRAALQTVREALAVLAGHLEAQAERSEGLARLHARSRALAELWQRWQEGGQNTDAIDADADARVRWMELTPHGLTLHATPLDVGQVFARRLEEDGRAWIFTSATLSVRGDFSHFLGQIGLPQAATAVWDSPYDYPAQALLYSPPDMPDPNTPGYTAAFIARAWPLIRASRGRAFVLFTSLKAMNEAFDLLRERLRGDALDWPLLLQGSDSRTALLERFRAAQHPILLGSQSFWEGVDVAGDALSLVIIDRLPFQPPDDPVLAARIEALRQAGRRPFFEVQLPQAVISLKQGAGRLIRRETDRGVLMIGDPRLVEKPYGKRIWQSLPPMTRTRVEAEAVAFFAAAT